MRKLATRALCLAASVVMLFLGHGCDDDDDSPNKGELWELTVEPPQITGYVGDDVEFVATLENGHDYSLSVTFLAQEGPIEPAGIFLIEHGSAERDIPAEGTVTVAFSGRCLSAGPSAIRVAASGTPHGGGSGDSMGIPVSVTCIDRGTGGAGGYGGSGGLGGAGGGGEPPTEFVWTNDGTGDIIDSISTVQAAYDAGEINIDQYTALMTDIYLQQAEAWFNSGLLQCGEVSSRGRVVCPTGVQDFPAGEMVSVAMRLVLPVPQDASSKSYIYSAVFESDGDSSNDWVFQLPTDWDFFQGADRWYRLIWNHASSQWSLTVTQVDGSQNMADVSSTSAARAVINDATIIFYIPRGELPGAAPSYRVTSFAHDGSYTLSSRGGDVSGANPTEALTAIP